MSIILVLEKTHLFHGENIYGCLRTGTIEACIIFGAKYVQKVIDNLNVCFLDMLIFNAYLVPNNAFWMRSRGVNSLSNGLTNYL
jgi:hypothetical protein